VLSEIELLVVEYKLSPLEVSEKLEGDERLSSSIEAEEETDDESLFVSIAVEFNVLSLMTDDLFDKFD
jgi:hypothetical protein